MRIKFKRGDIVNACGQMAVILDVLASPETDNVDIKVRFVRNIGDSRPYDILDLTPTRLKALGIDEWEVASMVELKSAIEKRKQYLEKEIDDLLSLAGQVETKGRCTQ